MTNQEQYELIWEKAKKYDRLVGVLDKIRAEIEQLPTNYIEVQRPHSVVERDVVELGAVMSIINKYKESEDEE